ncbi:hypothetical protein RHGRI_004534 [Rhododendron griersonianum]|uniref:Uncharacterized protein n=1 Tax=Rhododendron griersonianum TaxID=479676 RepID=A0AAV6LA07_9ERIC|nr:hypothetical protein RHGRI_004534 [Rhododendron griersonianum]
METIHHRWRYLREHRRANKSYITRPPKPRYAAYYCYRFNRAEAAKVQRKEEKIEMFSGPCSVTLSVMTAEIPSQITEIKRMRGTRGTYDPRGSHGQRSVTKIFAKP